MQKNISLTKTYCINKQTIGKLKRLEKKKQDQKSAQNFLKLLTKCENG